MEKYISVLQLLDIMGTAAFAISGVLAAMHKKLDLFGVVIIAFCTAIGGGTLRDILIGDLPVSWIRDISYTLVIILTVVLTIIFNRRLNYVRKTLFLFDSIGLGFFTIVGVQKGIAFGLHPGICIVLGTVSACFGGVIRDILLNNIPIIFRKEIYASACIVGAVIYFVFSLFWSNILAEIVCIAIVVIIRACAVKFNWQLPNIYRKRDE